MKVLSDLIQCIVLMHLLDAIWLATAVYFAFAPFGNRLGKIMLCFSNLLNGIMVFSFIGFYLGELAGFFAWGVIWFVVWLILLLFVRCESVQLFIFSIWTCVRFLLILGYNMVPIQAEADELIVFIWVAGIGGALAFVLIYPIRYKTVLTKNILFSFYGSCLLAGVLYDWIFDTSLSLHKFMMSEGDEWVNFFKITGKVVLDYDNSDRMLFYVTMFVLLIVSSLITRMFYVKRSQKA